MYKVQTLNNISLAGLSKLPKDEFDISSNIENPDAILVRSAKMHDIPIPANLKAVCRAGAGVNNIPISKMSEAGICVFNSPGANANSVKELAIASMLLASRNICQAWEYTKNLTGDDNNINKLVENGKKKYVGNELPSKTLGVVGLGAIGAQVSNAALALGMKVIGYDPTISVKSAWKLSPEVHQALNLEDLLIQTDIISFHVPLVDATRNLINSRSLATMRNNLIILNFARDGVVNDKDVLANFDNGKISCYVTDFPNNINKNHPKVIALPHLGASTEEAGDNCASMVSKQLRDFLHKGNIVNSVNLPEINISDIPENAKRMAIVNDNDAGIIAKITSFFAEQNLNIIDMINKSKDNLAYTLLDLQTSTINDDLIIKIAKIDGVKSVRICQK